MEKVSTKSKLSYCSISVISSHRVFPCFSFPLTNNKIDLVVIVEKALWHSQLLVDLWNAVVVQLFRTDWDYVLNFVAIWLCVSFFLLSIHLTKYEVRTHLNEIQLVIECVQNIELKKLFIQMDRVNLIYVKHTRRRVYFYFDFSPNIMLHIMI